MLQGMAKAAPQAVASTQRGDAHGPCTALAVVFPRRVSCCSLQVGRCGGSVQFNAGAGSATWRLSRASDTDLEDELSGWLQILRLRIEHAGDLIVHVVPTPQLHQLTIYLIHDFNFGESRRIMLSMIQSGSAEIGRAHV